VRSARSRVSAGACPTTRGRSWRERRTWRIRLLPEPCRPSTIGWMSSMHARSVTASSRWRSRSLESSMCAAALRTIAPWRFGRGDGGLARVEAEVHHLQPVHRLCASGYLHNSPTCVARTRPVVIGHHEVDHLRAPSESVGEARRGVDDVVEPGECGDSIRVPVGAGLDGSAVASSNTCGHGSGQPPAGSETTESVVTPDPTAGSGSARPRRCSSARLRRRTGRYQ